MIFRHADDFVPIQASLMLRKPLLPKSVKRFLSFRQCIRHAQKHKPRLFSRFPRDPVDLIIELIQHHQQLALRMAQKVTNLTAGQKRMKHVGHGSEAVERIHSVHHLRHIGRHYGNDVPRFHAQILKRFCRLIDPLQQLPVAHLAAFKIQRIQVRITLGGLLHERKHGTLRKLRAPCSGKLMIIPNGLFPFHETSPFSAYLQVQSAYKPVRNDTGLSRLKIMGAALDLRHAYPTVYIPRPFFLGTVYTRRENIPIADQHMNRNCTLSAHFTQKRHRSGRIPAEIG